ncbi:protein aurora borealis [Drosophila kikkawai]|uniref:Protein aurora borealis n=1 Tax=Drosophila kikkawai TaxID=30033 RepID=A0A6P4J6H0_DROKI|nr:protein aurora borealis [Drosophila kikkawai]
MYNDEARTPQALKSRYFTNLSGLKARARSNSYTKGHTPTASATKPTNGGKENGKYSPQMSAGVCTPPPKRLQKVQNPFEVALADRLHLPLIASPSLFQSRTPQLCSTQFEWNIDEVSQLKPADVEPHETQFHDSPDPEVESKAQLAISAFFKESHNVPSPVDCPLRKHRIILEDNTPISNKSKRRRDCEVQTELSLPPILPKALEDALRPYMQPHLAVGRLSGRSKSTGGSDIFNSSMRRKLFDLHNVIVLGDQQDSGEHSSPMAGSSPQAKQTLFAGRLSDSASGEGSFGSLSPIRNLCGLPPGTPDDGNCSGKRKLLMQEMELPSPIAASEHLSRRMAYSKVEVSVTEQHDTLSERTALKFTPDRSSSPMGGGLEHSDCSINQRVSRLRVNSTRQQVLVEAGDKPLFEETEEDEEEEEEEPDTEEEDEEGEVEAMQLSTLSFNCSSSNSDTPRGHRRRRSAQRKNLSQSFSANLEEEEDRDHAQDISLNQQVEQPLVVSPQQAPRIPLYRVDSGFNETTSTSTFACSQDLPMDVSMACCSTPSTRS